MKLSKSSHPKSLTATLFIIGAALLSFASSSYATISHTTCAGIIYNETAGLRGNLSAPRIQIGELAYQIGATQGLTPQIPTAAELQNPTTRAIWNACGSAATSAKGHSPVGNHYIMWPSGNGKTPTKTPRYPNNNFPYIYKVVKVYGPVSNPVKTGDVPVGNNIYFFFYKF